MHMVHLMRSASIRFPKMATSRDPGKKNWQPVHLWSVLRVDFMLFSILRMKKIIYMHGQGKEG